MIVEPASNSHWEDVCRIYNQGIRARNATFETREVAESEVRAWPSNQRVTVVASHDNAVVGFASYYPYSDRSCYAGVAEFSVYVDQSKQRAGIGPQLMRHLVDAARSNGVWKLLSRVFPENHPCRSMLKKIGFREVGVYEKHAQLEGKWRDVVIVEYLVEENF